MTGAGVRTLRYAGSDGVGEGDALVFQGSVWEEVAKHSCGERTFQEEKSRGKGPGAGECFHAQRTNCWDWRRGQELEYR